ncbi:ATP-binding cassette sub-family G member 1 isoform X2 [Anabrus simplex]|uniref:ATP-binding cassette sub-family G member 1 isoform X2 n=1 Tax=Anabrus simplex TaxID=316456 RepID=UPI0034DD420F
MSSVERLKAPRPADLRLEPCVPTSDLSSDRAITLSFRDLSYSVKKGIRRESRNILHSVSGEFQSGELAAIMGPSGAGKSSLMNILAGYTGLDSSTTKQCVSLLKLLAQEGRTIVCTIHQPSATLFEMFDHLYALSEGQCVYQGSVKGLVPFLGERGLPCPPYHNPADFLLEVLIGEHGDTQGLVTVMENGKCQDWRRRPTDRASLPFTVSMANGLRTPVFSPKMPPTPQLERPLPLRRFTSQYPTTFLTQFAILIKRTFLINLRDSFLIKSRLSMHLVIGLVIGMLYYNIGNDAAYVKDNFGFLYFCIMFLQFTAFSSKILTFPLELPILIREYFNRWYSLKSYYLALTVADAPVQLLCTLCYVLVSYFLTSQPRELYRLTLFLVVCLLVGLVSQSIGMLIGISMGIQNGMVFGPLAILPFLIFSGFFVAMKDAPWYFEWLFHASYLKYSLEGTMQAMYSYGRGKLPCSADYCHYTLPLKFLEELDMHHAAFWVDVVVLVSLDIVLKLIIYLALLYKLRHSR